jgi:CO/xanthine dehydrogenase FAD-binding subunit
MKSAPFDYHRPANVDEAIALKGELGGDARLLAGGQSLMPLMHFRLAVPAHLIDVNRLDDLDYVRRANGHLAIGATTRQQTVLTSQEAATTAPLMVSALGWVGHAQIRHRGTIAGSVAHADPSAEVPAVLLALGGSVIARSTAGEREIRAADLFTGPFSTSLSDDEMISEVRVPVWPEGTGFAWTEFSRIYHGFPVVGVGAAVHLADGEVDRAAIGMCGMAGTAIAVPVDSLLGRRPTDEVIAETAEAAVAGLDPPADIHGSGPYRLRVARAYIRRALIAAVAGPGGSE